MTKICFEFGPVEERERIELFEKLNSEEHVKNSCFEKLSKRFSIDRKTGSIDRKLYLIDPASIEHRSI